MLSWTRQDGNFQRSKHETSVTFKMHQKKVYAQLYCVTQQKISFLKITRSENWFDFPSQSQFPKNFSKDDRYSVSRHSTFLAQIHLLLRVAKIEDQSERRNHNDYEHLTTWWHKNIMTKKLEEKYHNPHNIIYEAIRQKKYVGKYFRSYLLCT